MAGDINIHVDYSPEYGAVTFNTDREPILTYRTRSTTGEAARDYQTGQPDAATGLVREDDFEVIDGWVLHTPDGQEWILGCWDLDDVDDAMAKARGYLRDRYGLTDAAAYKDWAKHL